MSGLYIHIPFCRKACTYCDFHFSTSLKTREAVLAAMQRELEVRAMELAGAPLGTIYFGGGTPSLMEPDAIAGFIDQARRLVRVEESAEVTLEVNPDDVDELRLSAWKAAGITRLSIGIQSFREERLRFMGRAHTAEQSDHALQLIAGAGFASWTLDLIYGLPGMTLEEWDAQIDAALAMGTPHISAYCLTVEEKTTLAHRVKAGDVVMPNDADQAAQFQRLIERMEQAGLVHYEISNFGREGHFSRHNTSYWHGVPYLGIGPSAHSFIGGVRRWNVAHNVRYAKGVEEGATYWQEETLTPAQRTNERLMTGLRTMWGVDLSTLEVDPEKENAPLIAHYLARGDMERRGTRLVLTRQGRAFADRIASDLFVADDR
ncbi:MAG: radical SAM family heme chaperone HemW [Flavobacteriales bacterium]|nr:radical SAM family heme chaperone HemW [Flavobacteriales bacterium]